MLRQDIYAQAAAQHLLTAQQREIAHIVGKHARLVGTHDRQSFRVAPDRRAGFALGQHHEIDAVMVLAQGRGLRRPAQYARTLRHGLDTLAHVAAQAAQRGMLAPGLRKLLWAQRRIAPRQIDHLPDGTAALLAGRLPLHAATATGAWALR